MALHEVQLKGYSVRPGNLSLGTFDSYGIEQLHVTLDDTWSGLAVTATFNPPEGEPVEIRVPENGLIDVPAEATANAGTGTVVYCGVANGVQRITKTQGYNVFTHGNVGTTVPFNPSESLATQVLQAALNAEKNSAEAKIAAANAVIVAANSAAAAKSSENAAANSATAAKVSENAAATSEDNARISAGAAAVSEGNAAASADKAKANKTAAEESEKAAAASAVAAAGSAAQAEAQKTAAAKSASDAQGYMQTASGAATAANASAENAAGSKAAAGNSASAAARSEQAAGASELKTAASEKAAKESEQAAAESAQAALESKTAAATSEVNAAASAKKAQDVADSLPEDYTTAVNDIVTLKQQVANITPDDSAIGDKPWSSKHIIDMLCPPLEESGNPVVCYPVAGYPLGVKAKWEPVQEGTGTPSPENIRPIKGRDSVTVERCGENLLDIAAFSLDVDKNNRTYQTNVQQLIPPGKYTLKVTHTNPNSGLGMQLFTRDGKKISGTSGNTFNLDGILDKIYFYIGNVSGNADSIKDIMLIPSTSTATTTYTPYIGQTNTLTLPETVYGGEVDARTGEGTITKCCFNLDDAINWKTTSYAENNDESGYGFMASYPHPHAAGDGRECLCSHLPYNWGLTSGYKDTGILVHDNGQVYVRVKIDGVNSVETWIAYLAAQKAAGTPVQACYKLRSPDDIRATGGAALSALAGVNTVLTDADSATVTGRADPIKRITDLEAAVASIN